jgi:hypothetical protein
MPQLTENAYPADVVRSTAWIVGKQELEPPRARRFVLFPVRARLPANVGIEKSVASGLKQYSFSFESD